MYKTLKGGNSEIRMFLEDDLLAQVESGVYDQIRNTANTPSVISTCLLPDCHTGYGAPIGSVVVTTGNVVPGPVGYDCGCGMSIYTTNIHADALKDRKLRRQVIDAIDRGIAMGEGRTATHGMIFSEPTFEDIVNYGAPQLVKMGVIPNNWPEKCERATHLIPEERFKLEEIPEKAYRGLNQLGTLGGGNHFCEVQKIEIADDPVSRDIAEKWELFDGQLVVMVHSGSRGFGHAFGEWAFKEFKAYCDKENLPYNDRELVYAPVDSPLGKQYMRFVAAGANFALCNRLLMAKVVKDAIQSVLPRVKVDLLYEISHNLAQWEPDQNGNLKLVHRKGTTRAFPAHHPLLRGTMWEESGHPVITPGSMGTFSAIQVGLEGAADSFFSINHGAGRRLSRSEARRTLDQRRVDEELDALDILTNCRHAPLDEAPKAYKDLNEVLKSVQAFNLAKVIAKCYPIASLKGSDEAKFRKNKEREQNKKERDKDRDDARKIKYK